MDNFDLNNLYKNITQKNKKKEDDKIKIYDKILKKCQQRIIYISNNNMYECFFEIPTFQFGCPLYNKMECANYIIDKLTNGGFQVHIITSEQLTQLGIEGNNNILRICWNK
tara:strand:+ start:1588 stop:1920 length:333 start_codon:yes stop_codon:yes gene_type:complete